MQGRSSLKRCKVVIVDDDEAIRGSLRLVVEEMGAEVIAEASDGISAIEQIRWSRPELILMDVAMPVAGGFYAARKLLEMNVNTPIIFVSQFIEQAFAEEALRVGGSAYVLKQAAFTELPTAIRAALAGETYISPIVAAAARRQGENRR
jgi:DNA-binding NarL/FixJ family response regulator